VDVIFCSFFDQNIVFELPRRIRVTLFFSWNSIYDLPFFFRTTQMFPQRNPRTLDVRSRAQKKWKALVQTPMRCLAVITVWNPSLQCDDRQIAHRCFYQWIQVGLATVPFRSTNKSEISRTKFRKSSIQASFHESNTLMARARGFPTLFSPQDYTKKIEVNYFRVKSNPTTKKTKIHPFAHSVDMRGETAKVSLAFDFRFVFFCLPCYI